ncbi:MAG: spermidine synthase [Phototrophicaceae bacterium]
MMIGRFYTIYHLRIAVFTSGLITLAVELSVSRLIGNVFGASNIVWANVIGLMLLYLTLGYFIGGRIADRNPSIILFYRLFIWGSFFCTLMPIMSIPILRWASIAMNSLAVPLALGAFISILLLFSVPITLLGMISPFAIRLAVSDVESSGKTVGQLYAIGTLGSLIGTFLPVLILIPAIGTIQTFLVLGVSGYLIGWIGISVHLKRFAWWYLVMVLINLLMGWLFFPSISRASLGEDFTVLYEDESAYNYIQVQEDRQGFRYLFLNEGQGIHSQWHPAVIFYGRTWDFFGVAPFFNPPETTEQPQNALIIGLAAGTIPRQLFRLFPDIEIDGIEIDQQIVEVGKRYFGMNETEMPNLQVVIADGRYGLNQSSHQYDLIGIDAYRPPYIPWHLTTVEFFEEIKQQLTADGVVVINVGRTPDDRRLVNAMAQTLSSVYPSVHAMDVPNTFNTILVATQQITQQTNLSANLAQIRGASASPELVQLLEYADTTHVPLVYSPVIFTDNDAPVEWMIDSIVFNFVAGNDYASLR